MNNLNEIFGIPNFDISENILNKYGIISMCIISEETFTPRLIVKYKEQEQESIDGIVEINLFLNKFKNNKLPTQEENPDGLYQRYIVEKVSGEPVGDNAEYFVLRLDKYGDDQIHIAACRKAIMTYADEIKDHLPKLSNDLIKRYKD